MKIPARVGSRPARVRKVGPSDRGEPTNGAGRREENRTLGFKSWLDRLSGRLRPTRATAEGEQPAAANPGTAPARADGAQQVTGTLVAINGDLRGQVFELFAGENKLGRGETSDVVLSASAISGEHAMIVHQEGIFAIVPLSENNPVLVNERQIDAAELLAGDTIRLGGTTFRFQTTGN